MSSALGTDLACSCGRIFAQHNALTNHQRNCRTTKARIADVLEKAKDMLHARKRRRLENQSSCVSSSATSSILPVPDPRPEEVSVMIKDTNSTKITTMQTDPVVFDEPVEPDLNLDLPIATRRAPRNLNRVAENIDILPQSHPSLPPHSNSSFEVANDTCSPAPAEMQSLTVIHSARNIFGLSRKYFTMTLPPHDPEELVTLKDLCSCAGPTREPTVSEFYDPYPNRNSFLLGDWYWNGGVQKSQQSFSDLLKIVGDSSFNPADIQHTKWSSINVALGRSEKDSTGEWLDTHAGWLKTPIQISVPFHRRTKQPGAQVYVGGDLYHRSIMDIIGERIRDPQSAQHFHLQPYELFWDAQLLKDGPATAVRVHGELYNSPAFLDAHRELQEGPGEPGCDLPRVIVALMFWSDATHLTSFGNAKIWPLYLFFGNESKYRRCQPSNNLCCHVAYFQDISDNFKDFATAQNGGRGQSRQFYTHCRREFLHEQLKIIFDEAFVHAYQHGSVFMCHDSIQRRFYPRIFTYSADYPEKIMLASIRSKGGCPCPRCLVPRDRIQNLGKFRDRQQRSTRQRIGDENLKSRISTARKLIYAKNHAVNSEAVENLLKPHSLVPTSNTFLEKLAPLPNFNTFSMFVVDLLHEVELGMWKSLFIHLLRVLYAKDKNLIHELDRRFRQVPTFGRGTIRKFSKNTSEMKKLAARDFEDILQCAIPVFEGLLLKRHNDIIMRLIFICAHWHGMAKLRLHTDITLDVMDKLTTELGQAFRDFQDKVCSAYETHELPRETAKRQRQAARKAASKSQNDGPSGQDAAQPKSTNKKTKQTAGNTKAIKDSAPTVRRRKGISLHTYKHHALGDYVETIRRFGTTDSYSTEMGELEHRSPKARYCRTDRKAFIKQLTQIERRQARIRRIKHKLNLPPGKSQDKAQMMTDHPEQHHHIGKSEHMSEDIGTFLRIHHDDPAIKDFVPDLKEHLLLRIKDILRKQNSLVFSPQSQITGTIDLTPGSHQDQLDGILFKHNRLYNHNILQINYTTYDVRRSQDVINPRTPHCNIMVLAAADGDNEGEDSHMFLYGRVMRIYHANVIYNGPGMIDHRPHRIEFLWIWWYDHLEPSGSWSAHRLDCLSFPPITRRGAFGFINPADVIRCSHIIPAFARGVRHGEGLGLITSLARRSEDWEMYYVNRFVDRDMLMRYYRGLAVGHIYPSKPMTDDSETQGLASPNALALADSDNELEDDDEMPPPNELLDLHILAADGNDNVSSSGSSDEETGLSDEEEGAEISSDEESGDMLEGDSESESSELAVEYDDMFGPEGDDDDD